MNLPKEKQTRSTSEHAQGQAQKWFHPGSNRGPSLRKSDVITNYTMKPSIYKGKRNKKSRKIKIRVKERIKKKDGEHKGEKGKVEKE